MTTVLEALNRALFRCLAEDERVYFLGEDILSPYGGAFKVYRGLSEQYPERVISTPVSEAGIIGLAGGMALRGLRPVVEIMFGDFLTLAADQLINHSAKFRWMYNNQVRVPLVVRTPMGGRRGYGPTHSQTLEKLFLGIPGLRVLAPCTLGDPGDLLLRAILEDDDPVLFVENKLIYSCDLLEPELDSDYVVSKSFSVDADPNPAGLDPLSAISYAPAYTVTVRGAPPPQLTLVAYGYAAELARKAMLELAFQDEVWVELVVPTQLAPYQIEPVLTSASATGRVLVIEEGSFTLGWGAEIVARLAEHLGPRLMLARRLAALDQPIAASREIESTQMPDMAQIMRTAKSMV